MLGARVRVSSLPLSRRGASVFETCGASGVVAPHAVWHQLSVDTRSYDTSDSVCRAATVCRAAVELQRPHARLVHTPPRLIIYSAVSNYILRHVSLCTPPRLIIYSAAPHYILRRASLYTPPRLIVYPAATHYILRRASSPPLPFIAAPHEPPPTTPPRPLPPPPPPRNVPCLFAPAGAAGAGVRPGAPGPLRCVCRALRPCGPRYVTCLAT
jgi:hypothetical protein